MGRRWRAVLLAVLAVCGVGLAVAVNVGTGGSLPGPLQPYQRYAWLAVAILTLAAVAGAVWQGIGEPRRVRRSAAPVSAADRARAATAIRQYVRARLDGSLGRMARIQLGMAAQPNAVNPPRDWYVDRPGPVPPLREDARIRDVFSDLDESMLVLGEPGAGKTTLLLELADQVLDQPEGPLPVLVELAGWAEPPDDGPRPVRREIPADLHDWLLGEVQRTYGIGVEVARRWLRARHLVLLLDGLDEVPEYAQASCARLIDGLQERYPRMRLVVSCRRQEYEQLPHRLTLRGALVIKPLDDARIDAFLGDPALAAVRAAVDEDPALRELLTAPLWLYVLTAVAETDRWQQPTDYDSVGARRRELLDAYIAQLAARPRSGKYGWDLHRTLRWLTTIARVLQTRGQTTVTRRGGVKGGSVSALPGSEQSLFARIVAPRVAVLCSLPLVYISARTFGAGGGLSGVFAAAAPAYLTGTLATLLYLRRPRFLDLRDRLRAWGLTIAALMLAAAGLAAAVPLAHAMADLPLPVRQVVLLLALAAPLGFLGVLLFDSDTVLAVIVFAVLVAGVVAAWNAGRTDAGTLAFTVGFLGTGVWFGPVSAVLSSLRRGNTAGLPLAGPLALRAVALTGAGLAAVVLAGQARGDASASVLVVLAAAGSAGAAAAMLVGRLIPTRWSDRCLLVYRGLLPIRLGKFLAFAADQGLLQREPDGYRFPHPLLAERFVHREPGIW
jgi:hypothetical protein